MSAGSANLGRAVFVLDADTGPFEAGYQRVENLTSQLVNRTGNILKTGLAIGLGTTVFRAGIEAAHNALSALGDGIIQFNSQLDQSQAVFTKFYGNTKAAADEVQRVFQFAKETPFNFEDVLKGATTLQALGGSALNTTEMLTKLGDAAAGTVNITGSLSEGFKETTFWTARFYEALQAGDPGGRAALRLEQLGLLTTQTRKQLELAAQAGASPDQLFAVYTAGLNRFNGLMAEQQKNFQTQISTLQDNFRQLAATAGRPIFEAFVAEMIKLNAAIDTDKVKAFASLLADNVQRGVHMVTSALEDQRNQEALLGLVKSAVDFGQFFAASGKEILDTIGPIAAGLRDLVDAIDRVTNNGALKFALLAAAVAKFHREIQLAYGVVTGSVNLFQPQRNDQGQLATGSERQRAAQSQYIQQQLALYQQLQQEEKAYAAASATVERARAQVAIANDQAIRQQIAVTLTARKEAAQAAAQIEKAAYSEATAAFKAQQAALVDAARQSAAIARQTGRDLTAAEREYQAALKASEAAVKSLSVAELQRQQQARVLTNRQILADDLKQELLALNQQEDAVRSRIENAAGGRRAVESQALLQQTAIAQREAAQRALARAQLEQQINPSTAADEAVAQATQRLTATRAAANELGTKSIALLEQETAVTKEIDRVTKEYTRSLAALQAQQERVAAAEEQVIASSQGVAASQIRAQTAGAGVQAAGAVDIVANQNAARAQAAAAANAAQREATIEADAQSLIGQKTAQAAQQQTTASAALQAARQRQIATTSQVEAAEAALVAAEEKQAAAQRAIIGTQAEMNAGIATTGSRLATLSQGLGIAVVGLLALNGIVDAISGQSIPQLIGSLIKYGDTLAQARQQVAQFNAEQAKASETDVNAIYEQEIARVKAQIEADRAYIQGYVGDVRNLLGDLLTEPGKLIGSPGRISAERNYLDQLTQAYTKLQEAQKLSNDELERRAKLAGEDQGIYQAEIDRRTADKQAADQARQQQLASVGLNLPPDVQQRLIGNFNQFEQNGKQAMEAFFQGASEADSKAYTDIVDQFIAGVAAELGAKKDDIPVLIDEQRVSGDIAKIIQDINQYGYITDQTTALVRQDAGDQAERILAIGRAYAATTADTKNYQDAVDALNAAQEQYKTDQAAAKAELDPLQQTIADFQNQSQRAQEQRQESIAGLQRELEDLQREAQDAQAISQRAIDAAQGELDAAQATAQADSARFQETIDRQQQELSAAQTALAQHQGVLQAALSGTTDQYLAEQGAVDDLTKKLSSRYETEIAAIRRLKDATSDRANAADVAQRAQLLAFDEAIARARDTGNAAQVAALSRQRQQFQTRSDRDVQLERERAQVAQDQFNARSNQLTRDAQRQQTADQQRVNAAQAALKATQDEQKAAEARDKAAVDAAQQHLKDVQAAAKAEQDNYKASEDALQRQIQDQQRADQDQATADKHHLQDLQDQYNERKKYWDNQLAQDQKDIDAATIVEQKAKETLDHDNNRITALQAQNKLLDEQKTKIQAIIDALTAAGLIQPPTPPAPSELPEGAAGSQPGISHPATPPAPTPAPPFTPTNDRPYVDGTYWEPSVPPPPGYHLEWYPVADGTKTPVIVWGPPPPPVTPVAPPTGTSGPIAGVQAVPAPPNPSGPGFAAARNILGTTSPLLGVQALQPTAGGYVFSVNGPLIGQATIREEADIGKLAAAINDQAYQSWQKVTRQGVRQGAVT